MDARSPAPPTVTFLFDIDGTLLRTEGAGLAALHSAFKTVFGIDQVAQVEVRGRTDRAIVRDIFAHHGIPESLEHWQEFQSEYLRELPQSLARRPGQLLPGVAATLDVLTRREHTALGLLTGNAHAAAQIKLSHFGIDHLFAFGGFGDHSVCRNQVAHQAVEAAATHLGEQFDRGAVCVIGDTPLDVACGRSIGARTIGVLTGSYDRESMEAAQPDLLLDDLSEFVLRFDQAGNSAAN